ncbi:MAG TPA: hypothetical protein PLU35_04100 [Phycisphaerales bacterium]|nr:hypothetical protein [Phycisphaerales bacterium]
MTIRDFGGLLATVAALSVAAFLVARSRLTTRRAKVAVIALGLVARAGIVLFFVGVFFEPTA